LGRYAERAENIARLLRTSLSRVRQVDLPEADYLLRLHGCFESRHSKLPKSGRPTLRDLEQEFISLLSDVKRPDSLPSTLDDVSRVSGRVRDRLSSDMMRLIGQLTGSVRIEEHMLFVEYSGVLGGCLELLSAFSGMERENVTRGSGWLFMSLGRRLERAMYSVRQMRELTGPFASADWPLLDYLLEVADSSMTYRSRYYTTLQPAAVLDVLMADGMNPRSLDFQLSHIADLYSKLPRHFPEELRSMQEAVAMLRSFDLQALDYPLPGAADTHGTAGERARLSRSLRLLEKLLPSWSNNLSSTYFTHARTLPMTVFE
jgi:uncharacterized alpha-E superfamily protein